MAGVSDRVTAVAFIFTVMYALLGLLLGGFIQLLNKSYFPSLPYTVVLFLIGLMISVGLSYFDQVSANTSNAQLASDINYLPQNSQIGWELIVYFFLPILIFGETMNLNWHHAISALSQSLWLAGPGAVIGCLLMGAFAKFFLPWMTWNVAFMFGSILSATDPVAVVSLLKTSGASHSLTLLIVGESLLNDGSAMVLFSLFLGLFQYTTEATFTSILVFFVKDALCSVLYGIAIGLITNRIMRFLDNPVKGADMNVQVVITLISCYISFNVAQASFEISGVLSASAAGLVLSWIAPPFLLHHEQMHQVWSSLEWICNTLIFFFAGLESGGLIKSYGDYADLYQVIILYLILLVIRVIVLSVLFPIISRGNLKCSVYDAMFMTWAGLRGALGIALALVVQNELEDSTYCANNNENKLCEGKFFVYIVGIVTCTLLFNATTSNILLRKLKLVVDKETSPQKRMVLDRIRRNFRKKMKISCEEELGKDFGGCNPKELAKLCSLLAETNIDDIDGNKSSIDYALRDSTGSSDGGVRLSALNDLVTDDRLSVYRENRNGSTAGVQLDLMDYARTSFLRHLRVLYDDAIMTGKIGRASYASQALLNSLDVAMDFTAQKEFGLKDWDSLIAVLDLNEWIVKFATSIDWISNKVGFYSERRAYAYVVARRDRRLVYALTNFITAHEAAQKLIPAIFGGNKDDQDSITGIPEVGQLRCESEDNVELARARLGEFSKTTIDKFNLQRAARIILLKQSHLVSEMVAEGTLSEKDAVLFYNIIDHDHAHVNKAREQLQKEFVKERTKQILSIEIPNIVNNNFRDSHVNHNLVGKTGQKNLKSLEAVSNERDESFHVGSNSNLSSDATMRLNIDVQNPMNSKDEEV